MTQEKGRYSNRTMRFDVAFYEKWDQLKKIEVITSENRLIIKVGLTHLWKMYYDFMSLKLAIDIH